MVFLMDIVISFLLMTRCIADVSTHCNSVEICGPIGALGAKKKELACLLVQQKAVDILVSKKWCWLSIENEAKREGTPPGCVTYWCSCLSGKRLDLV